MSVKANVALARSALAGRSQAAKAVTEYERVEEMGAGEEAQPGCVVRLISAVANFTTS